MSISDRELETGLDFLRKQILVVINADSENRFFSAAGPGQGDWKLHSVLESSVDPVVQTATFDTAAGLFRVPARSIVVFEQHRSRSDQVYFLIKGIDDAYHNEEISSHVVALLRWRAAASKWLFDRGFDHQASLFLKRLVRKIHYFERREALPEELADEWTHMIETILAI
jgi:hypothetical protein